ncbi:MAG: septal ring lytic transglycosylase RlpA family protein [Rhodospirillales bacterium]
MRAPAPRSAASLALRAGLAAAIGLGLSACAESHLASHAVKKAQRGMSAREQQAALPKDNEPRADGKPSFYKIGEPYQIDGKWYHPKEDYSYRETGIASWYGDEFHGRFTANGEIFNMHAVSAAHRTLPMPSVARVTNLENGRALVVRLNDRGPFVKNRIIDLSHRGAELLGFRAKGTARVKVEILAEESRRIKEAALQGRRVTLAELVAGAEADPEVMAAPGLMPAAGGDDGMPAALISREPPPPSAAPLIPVSSAPLDPPDRPEQLAAIQAGAGQAAGEAARAPAPPERPWTRLAYVQAGAYALFDNAVRAQTAMDGLGPATISPVTAGGQRYYRVRLGPYASAYHAETALEQVVKRGYAGAKIVAE